MDQLICPACNQPAGFYVSEDGPPTNHSVSADREVLWEDSMLEPTFTITCEGCGAEPDGDLWDEIYELCQG